MHHFDALLHHCQTKIRIKQVTLEWTLPPHEHTTSRLKYILHWKYTENILQVMDHALGRHLRRIAKLTRTRGIVYGCHQRAQWEYVARSSYWIWLGEYSSYVMIPLMTTNSVIVSSDNKILTYKLMAIKTQFLDENVLHTIYKYFKIILVTILHVYRNFSTYFIWASSLCNAWHPTNKQTIHHYQLYKATKIVSRLNQDLTKVKRTPTAL